MLAGLRLARRLGETRAFADPRDREVLPGPDAHEPDQERAFLRRVGEALAAAANPNPNAMVPAIAERAAALATGRA